MVAVSIVDNKWLAPFPIANFERMPEAPVEMPSFHCYDNPLPSITLPLLNDRPAPQKWLCPYRLQVLAAADSTFMDRLDGVRQ